MKNNSSVPAGATHYLPMRDGVTPQMYYKVNKHTYPDGETREGLVYFSPDFQTWRGSDERDIQKYIKERLILIK